MMQYSLLDRRPEESVLDLLHAHGIGVLARGALAQGLLVHKPEKDYLGQPAEVVNAAREAVHACVTESRSAAQVALAYALAHPAVTAAVAGARTTGQLEDMAGVFDAASLDDKEMDRLRQSIPKNVYTDHR